MSQIQWGQWISMDSRPEPVRKKVRGAEMLVMPSPYDVPEAVRVGFDFATNQLLVQFQYIETDSPVVRDVKQIARMYIGRHSGRLLGLSIDVEGFPRNSDISRAAENLKRALRKATPTRPDRQENFRMVQRGFERTDSLAMESLTRRDEGQDLVAE
jgi:hypothetical protein